MTLEIGRAVSDGLRRSVKRNGLVLMGVFVVVGLVSALAMQSLLAASMDSLPSQGAAGSNPFGSGTSLAFLPLPVAAVLAIVMAFVAEAARIVGVRTLVSDETETIPAEFRTRNLPLATLNGFVAGIVASVLWGIGLIFLIVPGLFLALSFYFYRQEVAVQDKNFIDALQDSWAIASGNRLPLLILALATAVIGIIITIPGMILGFVLGQGSMITGVVNVALGAVVTVVGMAIAARAYVQLTESDAAPEDGDGSGAADEGAVGADEGGQSNGTSGIPLAGEDEAESNDDDDEWDDPPGVDV